MHVGRKTGIRGFRIHESVHEREREQVLPNPLITTAVMDRARRGARIVFTWGMHAWSGGILRQVCEKSTLAYEEILVNGKGNDAVKMAFVVHGLMGSGRNWRTIAKRLATDVVESSPPGSAGWRMILIDQRNHGASASLPVSGPHDISAAAKDLADLLKAKGWDMPNVMIAHSLGGKVVLDFLQNAAAGSYGSVVLPKQLWVLDSVPGDVPMENSDGEVERVLATLKTLPKPVPSRRWLADHMVKLGFSKGLADWLGSNLKRISPSTEEMDWIFNIDGAYDMFASYRYCTAKQSYWSVLEDPPKGAHIAMVRASKSDRWTPDILERLEAAAKKNPDRVSYHILENAGHWLHTDNPSGLIAIMAPYLAKISK